MEQTMVIPSLVTEALSNSGFEGLKINDRITREDIYYKDNFEVRLLGSGHLLCRKKVKNKNGNAEYLVRYYIKFPDSKDVLEYLLTKGLE